MQAYKHLRQVTGSLASSPDPLFFWQPHTGMTDTTQHTEARQHTGEDNERKRPITDSPLLVPATMRQEWGCKGCDLGAIGPRLPPQPGEGEDEQTPRQAEQEGSTVEHHGGKPPHTVSLYVINNPLSACAVHTAVGITTCLLQVSRQVDSL